MNRPQTLIGRISALFQPELETRAPRRRVEQIVADIAAKHRQRRRKPPESGIAVPAIPPNGPLPRNGGAEAPLEFRED